MNKTVSQIDPKITYDKKITTSTKDITIPWAMVPIYRQAR